MAEQNDFIGAIKGMIDSRLYELNTSLPGVVVSYSGGRASVKPTPKRRFSDGDVIEFPVLQNVRVCWPSFAGGAAGVKGPVLAGDKCLIVFSQQAVDGTDDMRRFDLSDAYCVMADLGTAGAGDSSNNADMTLFYASGSVRVSAGGKVTITAPGGFDVVAPTMTNSGTLINSGLSTFTAGATFNGVPFSSHRHTGVTTGSGTSGGPV